MHFYIVGESELNRFITLAGSPPDGQVFEGFDERVRPATAETIAEPRFDYFLEAYTNILDDYDIELSPTEESEALDEATQGGCAWLVVSGKDASTLQKRVSRVKITEEDASNYLGDDISQSDLESLQLLHRQFTDAIGRVGRSQIGLLRCDL